MGRVMTWDPNSIYRTTKCFGAWSKNKNGTHYDGAFPAGFLKWVRKMGWWGNDRCYLCAGMVEDEEATRVDIQPGTNPTHCEDARATSLKEEKFDLVIIDPPYSRDLADALYGTGKYYHRINVFGEEAARIVRPGGLIITLSYEVPTTIKGCEFIAVCGIYTTPPIGSMRCFTVSRKRLPDQQGVLELGGGDVALNL